MQNSDQAFLPGTGTERSCLAFFQNSVCLALPQNSGIHLARAQNGQWHCLQAWAQNRLPGAGMTAERVERENSTRRVVPLVVFVVVFDALEVGTLTRTHSNPDQHHMHLVVLALRFCALPTDVCVYALTTLR
jgi:hypothetical protein